MNSHAPPPCPIIAPGMGATLADVHVERLVGQWFDVLAHDGRRDLARFVAFVDHDGASLGGNPVSQRKWANRAARAWGDSLLMLHLATAKRASYEVRLDVCAPMAASLPKDKARIGSDAPKPQWLYSWRFTVTRDGPSTKAHKSFNILAALSKHAIVRLIQRGGVETVAQLREAIVDFWPRLMLVEVLTRERRALAQGDVWFVPVVLASAPEPLVFVCSGPGVADRDGLFYVKTAMPVSMLKPADRDKVMRLHTADPDNFAAALDACRSRSP
jgi:hypothetical protein